MTNSKEKFSTTLIYGPTKSGKTTEIGAMAKYIYERYRKTTRLISADGGGWGPIQDYVDAGMIDALNISHSETPLPLLQRLARGDWHYKGDWVKRDDKNSGFDQVGMYAIEGFASIANMILMDPVNKGRKIAEDVVGKYTELDEDTKEEFTFGNASRAHYGFAQQRLLQFIKVFQGLLREGLELVLFTSLESSGEDDLSGRTILGPASIGKAMTGVIPSRVGDLIHLDTATITLQSTIDKSKTIQKDERRAYFRNHVDPEVKRAWPASFRFGPEATELIKQNAEMTKGYIRLDDEAAGVMREGVSKLFRWRDEMASVGVNKLKEFMNGGE